MKIINFDKEVARLNKKEIDGFTIKQFKKQKQGKYSLFRHFESEIACGCIGDFDCVNDAKEYAKREHARNELYAKMHSNTKMPKISLTIAKY